MKRQSVPAKNPTEMSEIEKRINITIENLVQRRNVLQNHLSQYKILRNRLEQWEKFQENDSPEITVAINQRGRVKAHVKNPRKVLAFIGSEYFVERDPLQAVEIVERKTKFLKESISDFEVKIKEAHSTLNGLKTLIDKKIPENNERKKSKYCFEEVSSEEDTFPLMDIREELDEEGNVISSSIKESYDELRDLMSENSKKASRELFQPIASSKETPPVIPKIEELHNDQDALFMEQHYKEKQKRIVTKEHNKEEKVAENIDLKINNNSVVSDVAENGFSFDEFEAQKSKGPVEGSEPKSEPENIEGVTYNEEDNVFFNLFKEMKIIDFNTGIPSVINGMRFTGNTSDEASLTDLPVSGSNLAIEVNDILQLQLISDDFDLEYLEDGETYEDEGIYDRDYYYEDDEYDESDWEEAEIKQSDDKDEILVVAEVKDENKNVPSEPIKDGDTPKSILKLSPNEKSKSVSFSSTLHIKEISKEPELFTVDNFTNSSSTQSRVSKFKQKISSEINYESKIDSSLNNNVQKNFDRPSHNFDAINSEPESEAAITEHLIEKTPVNFDTGLMVHTVHTPSSGKTSSDIPRGLNKNIINKDITLSDSKPLKLSRFKQMQLQSNKQAATVQIAVPTNISIEENTLAPVSLKSSVIQKHTTIDANNDYSESDIENFKKYLSEDIVDDDDVAIEQLLSVGDYQINPDDFEDVDNSSDDQEIDNDDSDEDYGPILSESIVENEYVEDPVYTVDNDQLQREYLKLREKIKSKYITNSSEKTTANDVISSYITDKGKEFEPIDEHGNPVKVSRFRKSLNRE